MKLDDLQSPMNSVQLAQLLKKHHGIELPVAQLTPARAQGMLESVQTQLNQYRNSKSAHLSEQDSNYTAMMLVEQTLRARLSEAEDGDNLLDPKKPFSSALKQAAKKLVGPLDQMGGQRSLLNPNSPVGQAWNQIKQSTGLQRHGITGPSANELVKKVVGTSMQKKKTSLPDISRVTGTNAKTLDNAMRTAGRNPAAIDAATAKILFSVWEKLVNTDVYRNLVRDGTINEKILTDALRRVTDPDNIDHRTANVLYTMLSKMPVSGALSESVRLNESAMGEAEVILAAKDLADRVQDMVETLGKMINEELPALTETIRDTMEATQADTYNTSALESLNATLEAVRGSKESLDVAARTLAGEEPAAPVDAGADGMDDLGGDGTEPEPGAEDNGEVADELMNTPAVASGGKKQPLGRGKR